MLRQALIVLAIGCCFLSPFSARPPSAWADTTAPAVTVGSGSNATVTPAPNTPAAKADADPVTTAKGVVADLKGGRWRLAIAGALALLFALALRLNSKIFGKTDRGKAIAVMVLAALGMLSASLATSTPISLEMLGGVATIAFTAVGGRQWLSRVLWPQDGGKPLLEGLQPWLGVKPKVDTPSAGA